MGIFRMSGTAGYLLIQCIYHKELYWRLLPRYLVKNLRMLQNLFKPEATISRSVFISDFVCMGVLLFFPCMTCPSVQHVHLSCTSKVSKTWNSPNTPLSQELRKMPIEPSRNQPLTSVPNVSRNGLLYLVSLGRIVSNPDEIPDHDVDDQVPRITLVGIL